MPLLASLHTATLIPSSIQRKYTENGKKEALRGGTKIIIEGEIYRGKKRSGGKICVWWVSKC